MRQQWRGVAAALVLGLAGTAAADDGDARAPVALTYDAPDVCADAALVRDEVTTRVPGAQFAADGGVLAIARIADTRDGYVGELTVVPPGGVAGAPRLFRPMATCEEAGLAIATELAGYVAGLPPAVLAPGELPPPPPKVRPLGRIEVGAGGEFGAGPDNTPALEVGYLRVRGPWWIGGAVRVQQHGGVGNASDAFPVDVKANDGLGLARVCRELTVVQACATAGIGVRQLTSKSRFPRSEEESEIGGFGVFGGRAAVVIPVGKAVVVEPWVEALTYAGELVYRDYFEDIGDTDYSVVVGVSIGLVELPKRPKSKPPS